MHPSCPGSWSALSKPAATPPASPPPWQSHGSWAPRVEEIFGEYRRRHQLPSPLWATSPSGAVGVVTVRIGDSVSYHPLPEVGQSWGRADGLYRDGQIKLFEDSDPSGIALAGCDPALGAGRIACCRITGPQRVVGIAAPSGKAIKALDEGRIHGALVHGRPGHLRSGERPARRFTAGPLAGRAGLPAGNPDRPGEAGPGHAHRHPARSGGRGARWPWSAG